VKYVIDTPYGALRVYNVHPVTPRQALVGDKDSGENISTREMQIAKAVEAARSDPPPFVLVGDTNLPPWSAIGRRRVGKLEEAWSEVGFGFGYTFPAKRPWMRIDRAFASDDVRFLDMRVAPRGASDHRAIFVDFELTDGR
jgi:endonuclease/exonuclease/phosphatase (EEP) superfamily protein YafD